MKYRITLPTSPNLEAIGDALRNIDPAALADLDTRAGTLRLSTGATEAEVLAVMATAGVRVEAGQIERLASECCGGCGG